MTLTREEIISRKPGPELDMFVAQIVMGWRLEGDMLHCGPKGWRVAEDYYPSNHIGDTWEMEEQIAVLEKEGYYVKALCDVVGTPRDGTRILAMDDWRMLHAKPEQRCKAALIAVLNL
ncbi:hypothetical protein [Paenibacillus sp. FSL R7-0333]|uniref:hypothetical protein n=1 Tax=Paenibacillus sp. FSL R7-0333 TaxID=1926587 RepID=UPI00096F3976|nr:hypothetical protein BK146_17855 [Paenibacillus sp. FSL R7-0333]